MFILHGTYHLGRKRLAYRNDFCLTCERENVAEQWRTFDLFHLFFVPVLPLGFWKRWHCAACGNNPHERVRTSKTLIIVFAAVVGLMAALFWMPPLIPPPADAQTFWTMRLIFSLGFPALVFWATRMKPVIGLKERLRQVKPLPTDSCWRCGGSLDRDGFCASCRLQRRQLDLAPSAWRPSDISQNQE